MRGTTMAKDEKDKAPRTLFTDLPSTGTGNAERLFKKYSSMLKKKYQVDIIDEIDEIADTYEEFGLGEGDYNWLRMRIRLKTGYKYPTPDILWACYKEWYAQTKDESGSPKTDTFKDHIWEETFTKAAVKFSKENAGRTPNPQYLKKKMAALIKPASKKSGKILPNPVRLGAARVSPAMVINADDLDWL